MSFTVIPPENQSFHEKSLPIKSWAGVIEESALKQARNLARLPFAIKQVALMPDAHAGYGMPIGGVLFTDRVVVPYAIGVDIGCGVVLLDTGIQCESEEATGVVRAVADMVAQSVPTGFNVRNVPEYSQSQLDIVMERERPEGIRQEWLDKAMPQMGTLGGGNHFIEFQSDGAGRLYVMLHSGSRSLGKNICDFYAKKALEENERYRVRLPDKQLAFLPVGGKYFTEYFDAMTYAMRWAEVNRDTMLMRVIDALYDVTDADEVNVVADCHHNYAAWENHWGQNGIVHRKGAVRAREGDVVLIPGSMGTGSYVGRGLGNPESFQSCQHGAGRALTRTAAKKAWSAEDTYALMAEAGIHLVSSSPADVSEEAPYAYKDIEDVMDHSEDLVEAVDYLTPVAVVKG